VPIYKPEKARRGLDYILFREDDRRVRTFATWYNMRGLQGVVAPLNFMVPMAEKCAFRWIVNTDSV
jgi:hypothetical protein